ncbi:MAG TPA: CDP-alcohol phosphatidyltransferase family protein [Nitrososphaeraceae archaeon]|nr:CDP-alcohol phosphatidyltransferase family protein [Nitrososphaeraceae archaeon]
MLNKLRQSLGPRLDRMGALFASSGLSPNFWTALSLIFAAASGLIYMSSVSSLGLNWYVSSLAGSMMLLISGFLDIVDGCVARATKRSDNKGAYLDSVFDKISESIIFIGIALGGHANPVISQVALALSLLVSYTRAKSEAVGIELKGVGIGERAERLLIVGILGLIPLEGILQFALLLVCLFAGITLCQRVVFTIRKL